MDDEVHTQRWQRIPAFPTDPLDALRAAIASVGAKPRDPEARRRLRALAAEQGTWDQLAVLLADEARAAADRPAVMSAFYEELADVHENLDQPLQTITAMEAVVQLEPDDVEHHDRLARLYHGVGAWAKAAEAFEGVARLAKDDRARAALRAAGRLYRDHGRLEKAVAAYRAVVELRPSDTDAWRVLDELLAELGRWREVADVRGTLAARVDGGVEKAVLLRGQARALEHAGDAAAAAELVASAAGHAPDDVSGIVDYATVLAREGRGREAADILSTRISEAVAADAAASDVAALRLRLARIFDETCADPAAAIAIIEALLAATPEYVPALEWRVARAARDPDPSAHAKALLRYAAALPDGAARAPSVIEAARKFRQARDHRSAVRAFEDATALAPDDDGLRRELEEARTTVAVEHAADAAATGDVADAEHRLRAILEAQPLHVEANLALAELLQANDRAAAAATHLRMTLAAAPEDAPQDRLARLVHRYSLALAALGEADEAHQLLHEAHRLDRRDLVITLALGESCFARRLWREAALHLGALADHPQASAHAMAVANGLVHAALAEIRALRPANATKRYEAAVRIDPNCARAWHALAERATDAKDLPRAADCLEREANATIEPRDRVRLFGALGDLALDTLGDPMRAERCWAEVIKLPAGDEQTPVLEKLLALQRRRGVGSERGKTCARLAELHVERRAKQNLLEEAVDAFVAGGDLVSARGVADQLVAAYPLDLYAVGSASAVPLATGDFDTAAAWLRRALIARDAAGDRGEGDPRRADLWRRLGDAERGRGNARAALPAYQRAVIASPESDGALGARRGLVELAATEGRPGGESLAALVEADQQPADVLAWARELVSSEQLDDARAAFELARAIGAHLDPADAPHVVPQRAMASDEAYGAVLDDADRRELIDDPADVPLGDLLEILGEVAALVYPDARTALDNANLDDATRVASSSIAATAALYPQIANMLGGPQTLVYTTTRESHPDLRLLVAAPPVVVTGPRLAKIRARTRGDTDAATTDGELRFWLGRVVELARARRVFAGGSDTAALVRLVGGLTHAFGQPSEASEPADAAEAERLRQALPLAIRRKLTDRLATIAPESLDPVAYAAGCMRAADRAGLLACGHIGIAIELAGGPATARHLVRFAATPRYLAARRKLRPRR